MTSPRELLSLYAVLMDKHDQLHRAITLFDCGLDFVDGLDTHVLNEGDRLVRASYLLDLYRSEFEKSIAELRNEIETLKRFDFRSE